MKNRPTCPLSFFSTTPFHSFFLGVGGHFPCLHHFSGSSSLPKESWSWPPNWTMAAARKSWGKKRCRCSSQREKCPAPERLQVKWMLNLVDAKCETELQTQPENWKLWGWWNYRIIHTCNNQADDILRIGYDCHDSHVDSATRRLIWGIWVKWRMATLTWQITSIAERYPSYTEFYMHVCM